MDTGSEKRRAVVLVSGGLDSSTTLAVCRQQGFLPYALTFDYGQRHRFEIEAAKKVCDSLSVEEHIVIPLDLRLFAGSALTSDIEVPKGRSESDMDADIPVTYVPARNTVFLSLALAWAETLGAFDLFIGVNAIDYSGYPDCRPEFIESFRRTAQLATKVGVEGQCVWQIHAPLIKLTKAETIRMGTDLGVDYSITHSCYDPTGDDGGPCGLCDACLLRLSGFADAGLEDPLRYPD